MRFKINSKINKLKDKIHNLEKHESKHELKISKLKYKISKIEYEAYKIGALGDGTFKLCDLEMWYLESKRLERRYKELRRLEMEKRWKIFWRIFGSNK